MKKKHLVTRTSFELAALLGLTPADALEWEFRYSISKRIIESFKKEVLQSLKLQLMQEPLELE